MALYTPAEANKILRQLQDEQKMILEYVYTNYDADEAADSYAYVTGLLDQIRTSLDTINNTAREISFELE